MPAPTGVPSCTVYSWTGPPTPGKTLTGTLLSAAIHGSSAQPSEELSPQNPMEASLFHWTLASGG
jgi:hypothetical protein